LNWQRLLKVVPNIERRPGHEYGFYLAAGATVVSIAAWSIVAWGLWRGIELTDEGFYLNSISLPFLYKATYTQFGFVLHPLYLLFGGDLILLRWSGLLLLTFAAAFFVSTFLRSSLIRLPLPTTVRLVLTVSGSCAVLVEYFPWTPTPNYNLLNLFGVLIILACWLRILEAPNDSSWWRRPGTMIAFALAFAIVALVKPTTAAVLAISVTGLTLPFGRRALTDVILAGGLAFVLTVLVLLSIDGDLSSVILRYRSSLVYVDLFQAGHDMNGTFEHGAETLLGLFGAYLLGRQLKQRLGAEPRYVALLTALIFAPIAIAFGTNTGILRSAPRAAIFWVVAATFGIMISAPSKIRLSLLYFTTAVSACCVLIVVVYTVRKPYRLNGPLWQQTEWISSATRQRVVKGDPATADYFRALVSGARSAGFQVETPIIDLTGMGPTAIYMLGGQPIGLPWMNGGYPGSRNGTLSVLSTVPGADLRRSWILTSPEGRGHLPTDILNELGLAFPDGYEEAARARTSYMNEEQILWRPRSAKALPACSDGCARP
jgi:hypothetical protein